jgi:hypothetical protein
MSAEFFLAFRKLHSIIGILNSCTAHCSLLSLHWISCNSEPPKVLRLQSKW